MNKKGLLLPFIFAGILFLIISTIFKKELPSQMEASSQIETPQIKKIFNGYVLVKGYNNYVCWIFTSTRKRQFLPDSYIVIDSFYGKAYIYSNYRLFHLTKENWKHAAQILKIDIEKCGDIIGGDND